MSKRGINLIDLEAERRAFEVQPDSSFTLIAAYLLAVSIGIGLALALLEWWTS